MSSTAPISHWHQPTRQLVHHDRRSWLHHHPALVSMPPTSAATCTDMPRSPHVDDLFGTHRIGTVRRELLDRMLILNRRQLETVLAEYVAHLNTHRPHRTLDQAAPLRALPPPALPSPLRIRRRRTDPRILPGRVTWMTSSAPTGKQPSLLTQRSVSFSVATSQTRYPLADLGEE